MAALIALSLPLLAALAADPQVVVLPTRTTAVTPERATAVSERVARALRDEGVALGRSPTEAAGALKTLGIRDSSECRGDAGCVTRLGKLLGAQFVIGVGVAEFEGTVVLHLEATASPPDGHPIIDDQVLPTDLEDPLWSRALTSFARRVLMRSGGVAPGRAEAPPASPPAPGRWRVALEGSSEIGALGGLYMVRAGRELLPGFTVSAGAMLTPAMATGASVQARAVPVGVEWMVHPVVSLEVPLMFRGDLAVGVRPGAGLEVVPLPWLSLTATASYLRLFGAPSLVRPDYWLGGAELGFRL